MKIRLFIIIFSFLFCFVSIATANVRKIQCKVVGIADGDTLTCLFERTQIKVRLQHIDAPENAQPFGNRAKQALATLAFKKQVRLEATGYDRYQRLLAVVFDEQNQNLNLKLVEMGMAWAYRQTQPIYQQAQQKAQATRIGLWQDKNPINPADWRANGDYNGSKNVAFLQMPQHSRVNCSYKRTCKQFTDYQDALRHFQQCGWQELDGNRDGIPCNKLYRKQRKND